jgi:hypothetical protein
LQNQPPLLNQVGSRHSRYAITRRLDCGLPVLNCTTNGRALDLLRPKI